MREALEQERQEKILFRTLLLKRTGDISVSTTEQLEQQPEQDYIPVHRSRSLTGILKQAKDKLDLKQAMSASAPAVLSELTEAEKVFQSSLNGAKH